MYQKASIQFPSSQELKDHAGAFATEHGDSLAEVCRRALAEYTGYDLEAEDKPVRKIRKYATIEERIAAQKQRMQERANLTKMLLAEYRAKHGKK
jgi:hypothetical protein